MKRHCAIEKEANEEGILINKNCVILKREKNIWLSKGSVQGNCYKNNEKKISRQSILFY